MITIKHDSLKNLYHYWMALAQQLNGKIAQEQNIKVFSTLSTPIFNQIYQTEALNSSDYHHLRETNREFFHNLPFTWWQLKDPSIITCLKNTKLACFGTVPVMVRETSGDLSLPSLPNYIAFKEVAAHDLMLWAPLFCDAWELSNRDVAKYLSALGACANQFTYIAAIDQRYNKVVGTATVFHDKTLAGFYNLCVDVPYRQQNIGAALHLLGIQKARHAGYTYITLQSTPKGIALGKRIGYQTVAAFDVYCDH